MIIRASECRQTDFILNLIKTIFFHSFPNEFIVEKLTIYFNAQKSTIFYKQQH